MARRVFGWEADILFQTSLLKSYVLDDHIVDLQRIAVGHQEVSQAELVKVRLFEVPDDVNSYGGVSLAEQVDIIFQIDLWIIIGIGLIKDAGIDVLSAEVNAVGRNNSRYEWVVVVVIGEVWRTIIIIWDCLH